MLSLWLGIANSDVGKRRGGSSFMTVSLLLGAVVTVKGTVSCDGISIDIIGTLRKKRKPRNPFQTRGFRTLSDCAGCCCGGDAGT